VPSGRIIAPSGRIIAHFGRIIAHFGRTRRIPGASSRTVRAHHRAFRANAARSTAPFLSPLPPSIRAHHRAFLPRASVQGECGASMHRFIRPMRPYLIAIRYRSIMPACGM
jgi:hypothetical protein